MMSAAAAFGKKEQIIYVRTVWKFHDFSIITQILREINFGDSRSAKCAILTLLKSLNFNLYECLHFLKSRIDQINKIQIPKNW